MGADRRQETPGSETTYFVTHARWAALPSATLYRFAPHSKTGGDDAEGPDGCLHVQWGALQKRSAELGGLSL